MPNWLNGDLKIRGSKKNIVRFLTEKLVQQTYRNKLENEDASDFLMNRLEEKPVFENIDSDYFEELEFNLLDNVHDVRIDGLRRTFIIDREYIYCSESNLTENEHIVILDVNIAWGIMTGHDNSPNDLERFRLLSEEYNLDFKFKGFETGGQFNTIMLIEKGIVKDFKEITFNDYAWECDFSRLGG